MLLSIPFLERFQIQLPESSFAYDLKSDFKVYANENAKLVEPMLISGKRETSLYKHRNDLRV